MLSDELTEELLELLRNCGYSEKVIGSFRNKVNMDRIENPDWVSKYTVSCGDTLEIYLKVNSGVIEDAKFLYVGYPPVGASESAITNMVKNKTLEEAGKLGNGYSCENSL